MIIKINGVTSWDAGDFVEYHVTGVDTNGKRFKIVTTDWNHARGINLYRGNKWGVKPDGTRMKLTEVYN